MDNKQKQVDNEQIKTDIDNKIEAGRQVDNKQR